MKLARGSREVFDIRSAQTLHDPTQDGDGSRNATQIARERFLAWVQVRSIIELNIVLGLT